MGKYLITLCLFFTSYSAFTQLETTTTSFFANDAEVEAWLNENQVPTLGIGVIEDGKIFTNFDTGAHVYEKLLKHYLGDKGKKIVDVETK